MKQKSKPRQSIQDCLKQSMEIFLRQVGTPLISFLKAYHLKLEFGKWVEMGLHGETWSLDWILII